MLFDKTQRGSAHLRIKFLYRIVWNIFHFMIIFWMAIITMRLNKHIWYRWRVILHWLSERRFLHYVKFFIPEEELRSCHLSCFNLHFPVSGISCGILITICEIVIVLISILLQVFDGSIETLFFREYLFLKKVQGTDLNLVWGTISLEVMLISCNGASTGIWFDWRH